MMRVVTVCVTCILVWGAGAGVAVAEVRFGNNVRIGGHDASNQTFNAKRRGEYYIYNTTPPRSGCVWRGNVDGSKTKICHLQRKVN